MSSRVTSGFDLLSNQMELLRSQLASLINLQEGVNGSISALSTSLSERLDASGYLSENLAYAGILDASDHIKRFNLSHSVILSSLKEVFQALKGSFLSSVQPIGHFAGALFFFERLSSKTPSSLTARESRVLRFLFERLIDAFRRYSARDVIYAYRVPEEVDRVHRVLYSFPDLSLLEGNNTLAQLLSSTPLSTLIDSGQVEIDAIGSPMESASEYQVASLAFDPNRVWDAVRDQFYRVYEDQVSPELSPDVSEEDFLLTALDDSSLISYVSAYEQTGLVAQTNSRNSFWLSNFSFWYSTYQSSKVFQVLSNTFVGVSRGAYSPPGFSILLRKIEDLMNFSIPKISYYNAGGIAGLVGPLCLMPAYLAIAYLLDPLSSPNAVSPWLYSFEIDYWDRLLDELSAPQDDDSGFSNPTLALSINEMRVELPEFKFYSLQSQVVDAVPGTSSTASNYIFNRIVADLVSTRTVDPVAITEALSSELRFGVGGSKEQLKGNFSGIWRYAHSLIEPEIYEVSASPNVLLLELSPSAIARYRAYNESLADDLLSIYEDEEFVRRSGLPFYYKPDRATPASVGMSYYLQLHPLTSAISHWIDIYITDIDRVSATLASWLVDPSDPQFEDYWQVSPSEALERARKAIYQQLDNYLQHGEKSSLNRTAMMIEARSVYAAGVMVALITQAPGPRGSVREVVTALVGTRAWSNKSFDSVVQAVAYSLFSKYYSS